MRQCGDHLIGSKLNVACFLLLLLFSFSFCVWAHLRRHQQFWWCAFLSESFPHCVVHDPHTHTHTACAGCSCLVWMCIWRYLYSQPTSTHTLDCSQQQQQPTSLVLLFFYIILLLLSCCCCCRVSNYARSFLRAAVHWIETPAVSFSTLLLPFNRRSLSPPPSPPPHHTERRRRQRRLNQQFSSSSFFSKRRKKRNKKRHTTSAHLCNYTGRW